MGLRPPRGRMGVPGRGAARGEEDVATAPQGGCDPPPPPRAGTPTPFPASRPRGSTPLSLHPRLFLASSLEPVCGGRPPAGSAPILMHRSPAPCPPGPPCPRPPPYPHWPAATPGSPPAGTPWGRREPPSWGKLAAWGQGRQGQPCSAGFARWAPLDVGGGVLGQPEECVGWEQGVKPPGMGWHRGARMAAAAQPGHGRLEPLAAPDQQPPPPPSPRAPVPPCAATRTVSASPRTCYLVTRL